MFFDILFVLWLCNNNIDSDPGGRCYNSVSEGPNYVHVKTCFLRKTAVLGLAILLIFGGRVSQMFFDILFVLLMRNHNIDSDPGGRCYNSVSEGPNYVHVKTWFLRKTAVLGLAILLIFGGRVSQMFFDILFVLWLCNNNIDSDPGGRCYNSVGEGPNYVHVKTWFLRKTAVLGLAILLIFGGRVSQMFFDILFVLLMRNHNIDSDPGGRCYNSVSEGPNYVHVKTWFLRKLAVLGLAILLIFGGRVSQMFFDILFVLWLCNNNIDSDPGGRCYNSVGEGPNYVHVKTWFLRKTAVLGLAILLIFGGRVSQMFFDILFVLLMCNHNIDSDPGGRCYNSVGEGPNYVHVKTWFLRKTAVLGLAILLIFGGRVSQMFFDILFVLWLCNHNIDSDPGGRCYNSVGEGPNYVHVKTWFLRKIAVLGLAILLIFGGRVSQMFFDILFVLWLCNNNIDSDPGDDVTTPLARGQTVFT